MKEKEIIRKMKENFNSYFRRFSNGSSTAYVDCNDDWSDYFKAVKTDMTYQEVAQIQEANAQKHCSYMDACPQVIQRKRNNVNVDTSWSAQNLEASQMKIIMQQQQWNEQQANMYNNNDSYAKQTNVSKQVDDDSDMYLAGMIKRKTVKKPVEIVETDKTAEPVIEVQKTEDVLCSKEELDEAKVLAEEIKNMSAESVLTDDTDVVIDDVIEEIKVVKDEELGVTDTESVVSDPVVDAVELTATESINEGNIDATNMSTEELMDVLGISADDIATAPVVEVEAVNVSEGEVIEDAVIVEEKKSTKKTTKTASAKKTSSTTKKAPAKKTSTSKKSTKSKK